MRITDFAISWIRTAVPAGVAFALTMLATKFGIFLDDGASATVAAAAVMLVTAGYYALARALEARWPKLGVLLGSTRQPTYTPPQG